MPANSDSSILWLFYFQIIFFLGPGVVALFDVWWRSTRASKSSDHAQDENVRVIRPSVPEPSPSEEDEEFRRAS